MLSDPDQRRLGFWAEPSEPGYRMHRFEREPPATVGSGLPTLGPYCCLLGALAHLDLACRRSKAYRPTGRDQASANAQVSLMAILSTFAD